MSYFKSMILLEKQIWSPNLYVSEPLYVDFDLQDKWDTFYWPKALKDKYKGPNLFISLPIKPKWKLRARAEMIIVDDEGRLLVDRKRSFKRAGYSVGFAGGGIEKGETALEAAIRETQEEAKLTLKNAFDSRIYYVYQSTKESKESYGYDGTASFICVGQKKGVYHGYIKKHDRDVFAERSEWVYPSEIPDWNKMKAHKEALKLFNERNK